MPAIYQACVTIDHKSQGELKFEAFGDSRIIAFDALIESVADFAMASPHLFPGIWLEGVDREKMATEWAADQVYEKGHDRPIVLGQGYINKCADFAYMQDEGDEKEWHLGRDIWLTIKTVDPCLTDEGDELVVGVKCDSDMVPAGVKNHFLEEKIFGVGRLGRSEATAIIEGCREIEDNDYSRAFKKQLKSADSLMADEQHLVVWYDGGFVFYMLDKTGEFMMTANIYLDDEEDMDEDLDDALDEIEDMESCEEEDGSLSRVVVHCEFSRVERMTNEEYDELLKQSFDEFLTSLEIPKH